MKFTLVVLTICFGLTYPSYAQDPEKEERQSLSYQEYYDFAASFDYESHSIGVEEFKVLSTQDHTVILDLRALEAYKRGHIKGALHLGADVTQEKMLSLVPDQETTLLLYCDNSLYLTRMMALTDITLPQIYQLGYKKLYKLDEAWRSGDEIRPIEDIEKDLDFVYPDLK